MILPPVDEGMVLFQAFAVASPTAYQLAKDRGFFDLTNPMFGKFPKWVAYGQHRTTCEKCNEV